MKLELYSLNNLTKDEFIMNVFPSTINNVTTNEFLFLYTFFKFSIPPLFSRRHFNFYQQTRVDNKITAGRHIRYPLSISYIIYM